jgi:hypothetical protein
VDLLFFHRRLRCLVIFDLKLGRFTHADAGQMHMYLNYAREHWVQSGENPPVGVILCSGKGEALVRYATDTLPNKLLVREYLTALPDEKLLAAELEKTRKQLEPRNERNAQELPPRLRSRRQAKATIGGSGEASIRKALEVSPNLPDPGALVLEIAEEL